MQHIAPPPWIAAGVALVGAGAIATTPAVAPLPGIPAVHSPATALTADFDLFGAWQDVFDTAKANADELTTVFERNPFIGAQQEIANQIGYLQDLSNGSASFSDVFNEIQTNATNVFNAATFLGGDQVEFINPLVGYTADNFHSIAFLALSGQAEEFGFPVPDAPIPTIVDFLASPLSGVLIGALGPSISPLVALSNSIQEVSDALNGDTPDWTTALQDLANIPANMAGGFLNGATLDLSSLIPLIEQSNLVALPEGASLDNVSIAFGGLLTPGETGATLSHLGTETIGGSILNSLGLNLSGVPIFGALDVPASGVGPLGAMELLSQLVATQLGWDGVANPLGDLFDGTDGADLP